MMISFQTNQHFGSFWHILPTGMPCQSLIAILQALSNIHQRSPESPCDFMAFPLRSPNCTPAKSRLGGSAKRNSLRLLRKCCLKLA